MPLTSASWYLAAATILSRSGLRDFAPTQRQHLVDWSRGLGMERGGLGEQQKRQAPNPKLKAQKKF
jgi:hypothetical protein